MHEERFSRDPLPVFSYQLARTDSALQTRISPRAVAQRAGTTVDEGRFLTSCMQVLFLKGSDIMPAQHSQPTPSSLPCSGFCGFYTTTCRCWAFSSERLTSRAVEFTCASTVVRAVHTTSRQALTSRHKSFLTRESRGKVPSPCLDRESNPRQQSLLGYLCSTELRPLSTRSVPV